MSVKQRGFSVVELMIALAISLVVILGMERIFVASFRANSAAIAYTNLNNQMRATMQAMSRDVRRSGFWAGAMADINEGSTTNPFFDVAYVDRSGDGVFDCILYGYDRDEDGDETDANEWRGFRWDSVNQMVEVKVGGGSRADVIGADCESPADGWEPFVDPNVIQITDLQFNDTTRRIVVDNNCPDAAEEFAITVRELDVRMDGRLTADNAVTRTLIDTIKLRNDQITLDPLPGGCP